MSAKGNQIRNKMIQSYAKTDGAKLAGLEKFLHVKFPEWAVKIEPYALFSKAEDEYLSCWDSLTEEQVKKYTVHHPDVWIVRGSMPILILELDGSWHDKHIEATNERDRRFRDNGFTLIVVNETDLKFELNLPISAKLSQDQINNAFWEKIKAQS